MKHILGKNKGIIQKILNKNVEEPGTKYVKEFIERLEKHVETDLNINWLVEKIKSRQCTLHPVKTFKAIWFIHKITLLPGLESYYEELQQMLKDFEYAAQRFANSEVNHAVPASAGRDDERELAKTALVYIDAIKLRLKTLANLQKYLTIRWQTRIDIEIFFSSTSKQTLSAVLNGLVLLATKLAELLNQFVTQKFSVFMQVYVIGLNEVMGELTLIFYTLAQLLENFDQFLASTEDHFYKTHSPVANDETVRHALLRACPKFEKYSVSLIVLIDNVLMYTFALAAKRFESLQGPLEELYMSRKLCVGILSKVLRLDSLEMSLDLSPTSLKELDCSPRDNNFLATRESSSASRLSDAVTDMGFSPTERRAPSFGSSEHENFLQQKKYKDTTTTPSTLISTATASYKNFKSNFTSSTNRLHKSVSPCKRDKFEPKLRSSAQIKTESALSLHHIPSSTNRYKKNETTEVPPRTTIQRHVSSVSRTGGGGYDTSNSNSSIYKMFRSHKPIGVNESKQQQQQQQHNNNRRQFSTAFSNSSNEYQLTKRSEDISEVTAQYTIQRSASTCIPQQKPPSGRALPQTDILVNHISQRPVSSSHAKKTDKFSPLVVQRNKGSLKLDLQDENVYASNSQIITSITNMNRSKINHNDTHGWQRHDSNAPFVTSHSHFVTAHPNHQMLRRGTPNHNNDYALQKPYTQKLNNTQVSKPVNQPVSSMPSTVRQQLNRGPQQKYKTESRVATVDYGSQGSYVCSTANAKQKEAAPHVRSPHLKHQQKGGSGYRHQAPPVRKGLNDLEVDLSDVVIDNLIGRGASSQVFKGTWRGAVVAVKHIQTSVCSSNEQHLTSSHREFYRELGVMLRLRHPNLVLFMGAKTGGETLCVVTEYCSGGNLYELLHGKSRSVGGGRRTTPIQLSWQQKIKICTDIARACQYLHSSKPAIIHRDLKSLNVLLANEIKTTNDVPIAKVSDFGLSRVKNGANGGWGPLTGVAGTCDWMAPEVILSKPYDEKADVYSYGIVMYEVLFQKKPYAEHQRESDIFSIAISVSKGKRPDISNPPSGCPSELLTLMQQCWTNDPRERPSFPEIADLLTELLV